MSSSTSDRHSRDEMIHRSRQKRSKFDPSAALTSVDRTGSEIPKKELVEAVLFVQAARNTTTREPNTGVGRAGRTREPNTGARRKAAKARHNERRAAPPRAGRDRGGAKDRPEAQTPTGIEPTAIVSGCEHLEKSSVSRGAGRLPRARCTAGLRAVGSRTQWQQWRARRLNHSIKPKP